MAQGGSGHSGIRMPLPPPPPLLRQVPPPVDLSRLPPPSPQPRVAVGVAAGPATGATPAYMNGAQPAQLTYNGQNGVQPGQKVIDLTNAGPATLDARNVSAWFSGRKVLERASLTMEARRVTALIGPSGCGKSTFIRTLNRMHENIPGAQVGGEVFLDGEDIYGGGLGITRVRLLIGMVFQKPNPFPSMSIAQNVLAGYRLTGRKPANAEETVEKSLRRAGLWEEVKDRLHQSGASLSGGQQQRLCIARALAMTPRVLLMDEPCSALDPISTRVIEETILELCDDVTIVIVTHNMQQAQRVSHQCAFFLVEKIGEPGRLVEAGPTRKMFEQPDDRRTGDYVNGRFG